ncbi:MAG TPA: IS110 family transposase [Oculatellaceae cyanobacterium]
MHHLGIDISKLTFDASLLIEGKYRNKKFDNDEAGFVALLQWLESYTAEDVHACMEGTGRLWEPLAEFLCERDIRVSVVNPLKIKGFARSELRRSKTDKLDAQVIARFCRAIAPAPWKAPDQCLKEIRDIQRATDALKKMVTQEKNRLQSGALPVIVKTMIEDHIKYLEAEIARLEEVVVRLAETKEEIMHKFRLLMSIVGIGQTTAITILSEVPYIEDFPSAKQLEVFAGISPRLYQSGSSVNGRTKISKVGNKRIRAALYMPALAAMRFNPFLKEFATRLKSAGKPGRVVVCAVMRKLLRLMYSIIKSGRPFDRNYVSAAPTAA